ncbi:MAG: transmembrane 220 family protein [Microscillaceae bacterium]|jgi:hypothetical protein|nr:transmembrane 220 family protein [Microscillaceae bacterium]
MIRILALLFAAMFFLFAYWQLNDPDAWWWVIAYLVPSGVSIGFFMGRSSRIVLFLLAVGYGVAAVMYYPEVYQGLGLENLAMKTPEVEFARESFGLGICALVFLFYAAVYRK